MPQHAAATGAAQLEVYEPCSAVKISSFSTQATRTQSSPRPPLALDLGSSVWEMVLEPIHPSLLQQSHWPPQLGPLPPPDWTLALSPLGSHLGQHLVSLGFHLLLQIPHLLCHGRHQLRVLEYRDCQPDKVLVPRPREEAEVWGSRGGGRGIPRSGNKVIAATTTYITGTKTLFIYQFMSSSQPASEDMNGFRKLIHRESQ